MPQTVSRAGLLCLSIGLGISCHGGPRDPLIEGLDLRLDDCMMVELPTQGQPVCILGEGMPFRLSVESPYDRPVDVRVLAMPAGETPSVVLDRVDVILPLRVTLPGPSSAGAFLGLVWPAGTQSPWSPRVASAEALPQGVPEDLVRDRVRFRVQPSMFDRILGDTALERCALAQWRKIPVQDGIAACRRAMVEPGELDGPADLEASYEHMALADLLIGTTDAALDEALGHALAAAARARAAGMPRMVVDAYRRALTIDHYRSRYEDVALWAAEAVSAAEESGDRALLATALRKRAEAARVRGRPTSAVEDLAEAVRLAAASGQTAESIIVRSELVAYLADYGAVLEFDEQVGAFAQDLPYDEAACPTAEAHGDWSRSDMGLALVAVADAIVRVDDSGVPTRWAGPQVLAMLACARRLNEASEADMREVALLSAQARAGSVSPADIAADLRSVEASYQAVGDSPSIYHASMLARVFQRIGRLDDAGRWYRALDQQFGHVDDAALRSAVGLASVALARGDLASARRHLDRGWVRYERWLANTQDEAQRIAQLNRAADAFEVGQRLALAAGRPEDAVDLLLRAPQLAQQSRDYAGCIDRPGIAALNEAYQRAAADAASMCQGEACGTSSLSVSQARIRLSNALAGCASSSTPPTGHTALQAALGEDEVLLIFARTSPTSAAAYRVSRSNLDVLALDHVDGWHAWVQRWREHLQADRLDGPGGSVLQALTWAVESRPKRLTVVPWGALHALPIHALPVRGAPLMEQAQVEVLPRPDLRLLATGVPKGPMLARPLVIGNPTRDLLGADAEAAALGRRLPQARVLLHEAASERAVLEALGDATLVHYAGHGALTPGLAQGARLRLGDGHELHSLDLLGRTLQAQLVVLHGCETGGMWSPGFAGSLGLVPTLLESGAGAVLATHWDVVEADGPAASGGAALMNEVYRQLELGQPASRAYRAAVLAALQGTLGPEAARPSVWSNYTLWQRQ